MADGGESKPQDAVKVETLGSRRRYPPRVFRLLHVPISFLGKLPGYVPEFLEIATDYRTCKGNK